MGDRTKGRNALANDESSKETEKQSARAKRRLRAPSETVREKAVKAQADIADTTPTKKHRVGRVLTSPFRALGWIGHQPPLRQIGHGLRWFGSLRFVRFLAKILGLRYVRDSWRELKLVAWPTKTQSRQLTFAVVVFSVIFGGLIAIVDFGLDKLFKQVILK
jgi:preprotein translocase SecE subunit